MAAFRSGNSPWSEAHPFTERRRGEFLALVHRLAGGWAAGKGGRGKDGGMTELAMLSSVWMVEHTGHHAWGSRSGVWRRDDCGGARHRRRRCAPSGGAGRRPLLLLWWAAPTPPLVVGDDLDCWVATSHLAWWAWRGGFPVFVGGGGVVGALSLGNCWLLLSGN
jgi:hypothetical protein